MIEGIERLENPENFQNDFKIIFTSIPLWYSPFSD
jgi:hypothetical protein